MWWKIGRYTILMTMITLRAETRKTAVQEVVQYIDTLYLYFIE